jgi:RNA polymerase sigma factor (sigma-70 family)
LDPRALCGARNGAKVRKNQSGSEYRIVIGERFEIVMAGCAIGTDAGLRRLCEEIAPLIRGYAKARGCQNPDDIVSETLIAVARDLVRFKGDEHDLRTFVFTVAHHRVERELSAPGVIRATTSQKILGITQKISEIEGALGSLSEDQRSVVLLRTLGDLSTKATAKIMGKRQKTIVWLETFGFTVLGERLGSRHGASNVKLIS